MSRESLGKGLEALFAIGPESTDRTTGITTLKIDSIVPNRYQPRKIFNPEKLSGLAESMKKNGILQPIIVTKNADSQYELVAGERRLEAARIAGFTEIPVIIRSISSREQLQFAIIENIQREDLNPVEEALAYQRLSTEFGLTHEEISKIVGKERTTISNCIRILKLSKEIQDYVMAGKLSSGHARAILQVPQERQGEFAHIIINKSYTVRKAEQEARRFGLKKATAPSSKSKKNDIQEKYENELKKKFSVKVKISASRNKGKISFFYNNRQELEEILKKLQVTDE